MLRNDTGTSRSGVIMFGPQAVVTVTQDPVSCATSVSPSSFEFPLTGGRTSFSVQTSTSDCYWRVTGFPPSIVPIIPFSTGWAFPADAPFSPATGVGSGSFAVATASNAFGDTPRSVTLTFGGSPGTSGAPTATISQPAPTCQFTFTPASVTIPANGGSATVNLTGQGSDCSYTTAVSFGPVTITGGASGTAPAAVTVTMGPNPTSLERFARVNAINAILSITQAGPPVVVDEFGVAFGAVRRTDGSVRVTAPEPVRITNEIDPSATWTATASQPWIVLSPSSGISPATMRISVDAAALASVQPGILAATIDIVSSVAPQTPLRLFITLYYYNGQPGTQQPSSIFGAPPLGVFDSPADGAAGLTGAIPITGWAVDGVMITGIKIYRNALAGEGAGDVFIGDATRVFGARTDLSIYKGYPEWRYGGWGYMLLSNVLPNGGNGTFTFSAYADDIEGNHTLLGRKTVTIDNAHAVKPFGTIDEPGQGQTVSGTIVNRGWVLTPAGKTIPFDGSTIKVYIDGALVAPVTSYNRPRPDVKAYFPGLANSNGPEAVLSIDTTQFADGLHTIAWVVVDDNGDAEGIGSRFFTIQNGAASQVLAPDTTRAASGVRAMPRLDTEVWAQTGVDESRSSFRVDPDARGTRAIQLVQGERIAVTLDRWTSAWCGTYDGHLLSGEVAAPLPLGASLDPSRGIFQWMPAAEFTGTYRFVFVQHGCDGAERVIPLSVIIGSR